MRHLYQRVAPARTDGDAPRIPVCNRATADPTT
jgi:hypothetical protein